MSNLENWPFLLVEVAVTAKRSISGNMRTSSERKLGGPSFESLPRTVKRGMLWAK
jgi:hypothetical protein